MNSLRIVGALDAAGNNIHLNITQGTITAAISTGRQFDATGLVALPGFIDIQTNGGYGHDFTLDPASIWKVGALLPRTGVTAFYPTIITSPSGTIERAQEAIAARPDGYEGAEPLGLHIEGPYLSEARHGTHPLDLLQDATSWNVPTDHIAIVTLAPEVPGAIDLIRKLTGEGVVVSIGHSAAPTETAREALDAGATLGTHLFNAMDPISGREPGVAGVLLTDTRASFGMIIDGIHLAPETVRLAWSAASDRLILVTDAVAAAGMADGTYEIGEIEVTLTDGAVRNARGDLAGSSLTMDRALSNLIEVTTADLASAATCAGAHPARALGLTDRGTLRPGAVADVVLWGDGAVVATITGGVIAFNTEPDRMKGQSHASP